MKKQDEFKEGKTVEVIKLLKRTVTINEKIEELIDWSARYSKAKVQFTNFPIDILRAYAQFEEKLKTSRAI